MILRRSYQCIFILLACELLLSTSFGQWQSHAVCFLESSGNAQRIPAQFQMVTESWDRVTAVPYISYMPEIDRLLLLLNCDYPHHTNVLWSDDQGETWTSPKSLHQTQASAGYPEVGFGTALNYLGDGKVMFYTGLNGVSSRWFSEDYGQTWGESVPVANTTEGMPWYIWDSPLVERNPQTGVVTRIAETGYNWVGPVSAPDSYQQAYIRFSNDEGQTWTQDIKVPQWQGVSEVALHRADNGNILGACRTDMPERFGNSLDHYEGLGISTSTNNGQTWSEVDKLYDWGRHHASMVAMPDGRIVMTYVVRKGYTDSDDGRNRYGVEAIISNDNGATWDLDHRYILHSWEGDKDLTWWPSSQATSSELMPDGSIVTTFGTGYRCGPSEVPNQPAPRDVGLIRWRPNGQTTTFGGPITSASVESDLRNVFELPVLPLETTQVFYEDFECVSVGSSLVGSIPGWTGTYDSLISSNLLDSGKSLDLCAGGATEWPIAKIEFPRTPSTVEEYVFSGTLEEADITGGYADLRLVSSSDDSFIQAALGYGKLAFVMWDGGASSADNIRMEINVPREGSAPPVDVKMVLDGGRTDCYWRENGTTSWIHAGGVDYGINLSLYDAIMLVGHDIGDSTYSGGMDSISLVRTAPSSTFIPGDANDDGKVDGSDVTILAGNWQAGVGAPDRNAITWAMGDFNGDGQIDGSDVTILAGNWQYGVSTAAVSVPEPSVFVLLSCGLLSLWRYKSEQRKRVL